MDQNSKQCCVCGSTLNCRYHFGAITCGGCSIFFKRAVDNHQVYRCFMGENCDISKKQGIIRCKACRMKGCIRAGMAVEAAQRAAAKLEGSRKAEMTSEPAPQPKPDFVSVSVIKFAHNPRSTNHEERIPTHDSVTHHAPFLPMDSGALISGQRLYITSLPGHENRMPPSLRKYNTYLTAKNNLLNSSARAIENAAWVIFSDQIYEFSAYMNSALISSFPREPEFSREAIAEAVASDAQDIFTRFLKFLDVIPGFEYFTQQEKEQIAEKKYVDIRMIHYSPYVENGEIYRFAGPQKLHFSRDSLKSVADHDYVRIGMRCLALIKELDLTMKELYVFMTARLCYPESGLPNLPVLQLMHNHFMDVLENSIRSRSLEGDNVMEKLDNISAELDKMKERFSGFVRFAV